MEIWLKVDNWNPDILPEQDGFSLVPESNEYNNVFGPVAPEFFLYLPLILERHP
jgi:hypothetical protein